jgi:hypothetical protein
MWYFDVAVLLLQNFRVNVIKCINYQQKHFNFMMYFYLLYIHQHVSASNPNIFRVTIQEYNCS